MYYCTLAEARAELKATTSTVQDNQLLRNVRIVSRRIDQIMTGYSNRFYFAPVIKTYKIPLDGRHINSRENSLLLRGLPPLLALTTLSVDGTDVTSVAEGYPQGEAMFSRVRVTSSGNLLYSYITDCDDPAYVELTGIWGYHSDYANAWLAVDALAAQQLVGAASATVANVDGEDPYGITPRLSQGALIKIDSEYELVTDTDTATNIATTTRAQHGSTAVQHEAAATVSWWQVEEPIKRIAARQAALMVARQGAFQVETVDGVGTVSYPQDLLPELTIVLRGYINGR